MRRPTTRNRRATVLLSLLCGALVVLAPSPRPSSPSATAAAGTLPVDAGWLETVNHYRVGAGLAPVVEEPAWTDGARKHLDYLAYTPASLRTGAFASSHTENPASAWYTPEGAAAAAAANIGTGGMPRDVIDEWMRAPFHAIGLLRPGLQRSGFASGTGASMIDVIRGIGTAPSPAPTVLFPGPGTTTYLDRFTGERPDPREGCASDWNQFAGLPLIAMLPAPAPAGTTATLTLPDGTTLSQGNDLCVQTAATFRSSDAVYGPTGQQLLANDNAVLVMPRARLRPGVHTATIRRPGSADITWSFTVLGTPNVPTAVRSLWAGAGKVHVSWAPPVPVDGAEIDTYAIGPADVPSRQIVPATTRSMVVDVPAAPSGSVTVAASTQYATGPAAFDAWSRPNLPGAPGVGRLLAVPSAPPAGTEAVLANLAMVDGEAVGYITADRCSAMKDEPQTEASGNHGVGGAIANLAVVPVDTDGSFCIYSQVPTHLVVDVQGSFSPAGALAFDPVAPVRLLDTRVAENGRSGAIPMSGEIVRVQTGAPRGTAAALVNLAMTDGMLAGYITADRCSTLQPGPQAKASGNHDVGTAIANLAVVPLDPDGSFCIFTQVPTHLVVDLQGTFSTGGSLRLTPTSPARLLDTRVAGNGRTGVIPTAGEIVRVQTGAPAGTTAALVNLAMTDATVPGYVTADRCSALRPGQQTKASGNHGAGMAIANLAVVPLDPDGSFCIFTQVPTHLVVDLQGTFSSSGALRFTPAAPDAVQRVLDTRR